MTWIDESLAPIPGTYELFWRTWLASQDLGSYKGTGVPAKLLELLKPFSPQTELLPEKAQLLVFRLLENEKNWSLGSLLHSDPKDPHERWVIGAYWSNLFFAGLAPEFHQQLRGSLKAGQTVQLGVPGSSLETVPLAVGMLSKGKRIRFSAFHFLEPVRRNLAVRKFVLLPDPKDAARLALASAHSATQLLDVSFPFRVGHVQVDERPGYAAITELQSNFNAAKANAAAISKKEPLLSQSFLDSYYAWASRLLGPLISFYRRTDRVVVYPTPETYAAMHENAEGHAGSARRIADEIRLLSKDLHFQTVPLAPSETKALHLYGNWRKVVFRTVKSEASRRRAMRERV